MRYLVTMQAGIAFGDDNGGAAYWLTDFEDGAAVRAPDGRLIANTFRATPADKDGKRRRVYVRGVYVPCDEVNLALPEHATIGVVDMGCD